MTIEAEPKSKYEGWDLSDLKARERELAEDLAEKKRELKKQEMEALKGDPELEEMWKEVKKARKHQREVEHEQKREKEERIEKIRSIYARINPKEFVEVTPLKEFFNPDFMRFISGEQYMALMESDRLTDDKKRKATKARFKFCWDWIDPKKNEEMAAYRKQKAAYEKAFADWLERLKDDPNAKGPLDEEGKIIEDPGFPPINPEIKEMFRNNIRNIKELALIHRYEPEIFDHFDFVAHIRFPHIQEMRRHEAFAGRGKHIREKKVEDFIDIVKHLENMGIKGGDSETYFEELDPIQITKLRERMITAYRGKSPGEISGLGGRSWKSPVTLDLMDRTIVNTFFQNDNEDKILIWEHILIGLATGKISDSNKDALGWLRSHKRGREFYGDSERIISGIEKKYPNLRDKLSEYRLSEK